MPAAPSENSAPLCTSWCRKGAVSTDLEGRSLIFSENRQAIYRCDSSTAKIWRSIERGLDPAEIIEKLAAQGADPEHARGTVANVIRSGVELGILEARTNAAGRNGGSPQRISLAGMGVEISFAEPLAETLLPSFAHLADHWVEPLHSIVLTEVDGLVRVMCDGVEEHSCAVETCVPAIKALLLEKLLASPGYEVALHAAALLKNERMLLLNARPGGGKSTLTAALVHHGFGYCGDDLALVDKEGRVRGAPFAITLKDGAAALLAASIPTLAAIPRFIRLDGKRVRYVAPPTIASVIAERVRWFVLLDRQRDARADLNRIDKLDAMRAMLKSGHSRQGRLTVAGFEALAAMLRGAACLRLTYSDLGEAVARLEEVCG